MAKIDTYATMAQSVDYSNTHYSEIISDQDLVDMSSSVLSNEIGLGADRSTASIGTWPGPFYVYDLIANGFTEIQNTIKFNAMQLEMILKLKNPSGVLFARCNFLLSPHNYLASLLDCPIYVPIDEDLYRSENNWLNSETPLNVVDPLDTLNGIVPEGVDTIVMSAARVPESTNSNLISDLFNALPSGGTLILTESNDFNLLYSTESLSPMYSIVQEVLALLGSKCYHIPTGVGFTIITKD